MVPVEAQAAGRPVIAFGAGGALETVVENRSGIFFDQQDVPGVISAIERFETTTDLWPAERIQEHARTLSIERFRKRCLASHNWCLSPHNSGGPARVREAVSDLAPDEFN